MPHTKKKRRPAMVHRATQNNSQSNSSRTTKSATAGQGFIAPLLSVTTGKLNICSLPNTKGDGFERHILTRDPAEIARFVARDDRRENKRGIYYCVSTIKGKRLKVNAVESPFLHVDIDPKDHSLSNVKVVRVLKALPLPPSCIVKSGNGVHAYWWFPKALPCADHLEDIERLLKRLANILAGDSSPAHCAALMRWPGSHNSKYGKWTEVKIVELNRRRYTLAKLTTWLNNSNIVIPRKGKEIPDDNYFLHHGREHVFKPPVDVTARLKAMTFEGGVINGVHSTQVSCSAALLLRGMDVDDVVAVLLEATQKAAKGLHWNWRREERVVREMCVDWLRKHPRIEGDAA